MFDFVAFIPRAVAQGVPLMLGSTGETLTQKSGNLNLGLPGVMYVGAICGVIGSFMYETSGVAMNGFLFRTINPVVRILFLAGGLCMLIPESISDVVGIVLVAALCAYQYLSAKRSGSGSAAAA